MSRWINQIVDGGGMQIVTALQPLGADSIEGVYESRAATALLLSSIIAKVGVEL